MLAVDANGTRFHLLLGERDWSECHDAGHPPTVLEQHFRRAAEPCESSDSAFAWDPRANEITLRPCVVRFEAAPADRPPDPVGRDRRGGARDRYGNFYWIAESATEIRVLPSGSGAASHFWSAGEGLECAADQRHGGFQPVAAAAPPPQLRLSGLAITDDHYLCVGVLDPPGMLIFDLHAGGPPEQFCWPATVPFAPFDLASRRGGGVWILDRLHRQYWGLDRHFAQIVLRQEPLPDVPSVDHFHPIEPGGDGSLATRRLPEPVRAEAAAAIAAADPIAIEGLADGTVLILDGQRAAGEAHLLRYRLADRLPDPEWHEPFGITPYDLVHVPDRPDGASVAGRFVIASISGNQAYAFAVSEPGPDRVLLSLLPEYLPMRLFGGKGLLATGSEVYYDFFDGWVPLVVQQRPRYAQQATLRTPALDGREPACVWHRLMLDACVPAEAAIDVRSRAADDPIDLEMTQWQAEPSPYVRRDGPELPFAPRTGRDRDGTWELLFQRARGRYLQLEITFRGNGRVTPRVRALRAYYPRFSYLERYLPGVYREEPESASFLDRFLANAEGFYTAIEDRVAAVQTLFDHRSAPGEALDWLAGWFGVALDPAWSDAKRRLFISHAAEFFDTRGTIRGLRAAVRLATDECADGSIFGRPATSRRRADPIRIVELHRTRSQPAVVAGDPTDVTGLRTVVQAARWSPADGRSALNDRYVTWLKAEGGTDVTAFPVREPNDIARARSWRRFSADVLGFVPSATAGDTDAWRDFLARRYHRRSALLSTYGVSLNTALSFDTMPLPLVLPSDGAPLVDWYQFESIVMAMRRTAHRFLVLLPVTSIAVQEDARRERLNLVRRVVNLEKPAHTLFDVRFYWALFRIGEARLGLDSLVERGGRAPDLLPALRLGQAHLGESHLAPAHPHDVPDRHVVGRDAVQQHDTEERHV